MNELERAARDYTSRGIPVIALTGKRPNTEVHRAWLEDCLTSASSMESFLTAFGHKCTTGIGMVIPHPYVVVDIDSEEGARNWKGLVGEDYIPDRWVAKTAHGLHIWYANIEPTGSFKPFGPKGGVDLKGQKSYVAAPPSWHPGYPDEGIAPGNHYEWLLEPGDQPPLEAPDALAALIHEHNFDVEGAKVRKVRNTRVRHQPLEGGLLWASIGFDHLYEGMRNEPIGNRNNYLHWAASVMAEEGATDEEFRMLKACAPDLGIAAKRTIKSARDKFRE